MNELTYHCVYILINNNHNNNLLDESKDIKNMKMANLIISQCQTNFVNIIYTRLKIT